MYLNNDKIWCRTTVRYLDSSATRTKVRQRGDLSKIRCRTTVRVALQYVYRLDFDKINFKIWNLEFELEVVRSDENSNLNSQFLHFQCDGLFITFPVFLRLKL